jgi:hypothetical protein
MNIHSSSTPYLNINLGVLQQSFMYAVTHKNHAGCATMPSCFTASVTVQLQSQYKAKESYITNQQVTFASTNVY